MEEGFLLTQGCKRCSPSWWGRQAADSCLTETAQVATCSYLSTTRRETRREQCRLQTSTPSQESTSSFSQTLPPEGSRTCKSPAGDQMCKHTNLRGSFSIQTAAPSPTLCSVESFFFQSCLFPSIHFYYFGRQTLHILLLPCVRWQLFPRLSPRRHHRISSIGVYRVSPCGLGRSETHQVAQTVNPPASVS